VVSHITPSDVNPLHGCVDGEALENWGAVTHSITAVDNHAGGLALGIQAQDGLRLEEDAR